MVAALVAAWYDSGGKATPALPAAPPHRPTLIRRINDLHAEGHATEDIAKGVQWLAEAAAQPITLHFYVNRARLLREAADHRDRMADERRYTDAIKREGESVWDSLARDVVARVDPSSEPRPSSSSPQADPSASSDARPAARPTT